MKTAKKKKVDLLTIGGDLFESAKDAEVLRPQLRELFSNNDFSIIAIPGNHDKEAYTKDTDFGSDLKVSIEEPFDVSVFDKTAIISVPYRDKPSEQLYSELREAEKDADHRLLLLHCTLDIGFTSYDFGEDIDVKYFPITKTTLSRLGFDYILAGHFHTESCVIQIPGNCRFIYPGSPVSHSKKEVGKRKGYLIDTDSGKIKSIQFDTFYNDCLRVEAKHGREDDVIKLIREWIDDRKKDDCLLEIEITGFIEMDEKQFGKKIRKEIEGLSDKVTIHPLHRHVNKVLKHPLFQRFKDKMEEEESMEDREEVESFVIDAMSRLIADGKLRK